MAYESQRFRAENYPRSSDNFEREHAHYITPGSYHSYPESHREISGRVPHQPEPRFQPERHDDDYGRRMSYHQRPLPPTYVDHPRHRKEFSYYGNGNASKSSSTTTTQPPMLGLPHSHSQRHPQQDRLPGRAILPHPRPGVGIYPQTQEPLDGHGHSHGYDGLDHRLPVRPSSLSGPNPVQHYALRPSPPEMHRFRPRPRDGSLDATHSSNYPDSVDETGTTSSATQQQLPEETNSLQRSTKFPSSRSLNGGGGSGSPVTIGSTLQDETSSQSLNKPKAAEIKNDMLSDALLLASVASMARSEVVKKISPSSSSEAEPDVLEEGVKEEEQEDDDLPLNCPSGSGGGNVSSSRRNHQTKEEKLTKRNSTPSPQEYHTTTVTPTASTILSSVKIVKHFQDLEAKPLLQPKLQRDDNSDEGVEREMARRGPIQIASSRDQGDYNTHTPSSESPPTLSQSQSHPPPFFDGVPRPPVEGAPMIGGGGPPRQQRQHTLMPRKGSVGSYHDDDDRVAYPVSHRNHNPQPHPRLNNERGMAGGRGGGEGYFPPHARPHPMDREQYMSMRERPMYEEHRRYHHHNHHTATEPMYDSYPPAHYPRGGEPGHDGHFRPLPPYDGRRPIPRDMRSHHPHPIDLRDRHCSMPRMLGPGGAAAHHEDHGPYYHAHPPPPHHARHSSKNLRGKTILRRKCAWKNYPELEKFLINNREEYLRHSAMNYTAEQKQFNNDLTKKLLEVAERYDYEFDPEDFNFVAIRDRIRCYYKSYVQNCKKRGIAVGYDAMGRKRQKIEGSEDSVGDSFDDDAKSNAKDDNEQEEKVEDNKNDDADSSPQSRKDEKSPDPPEAVECKTEDKQE